jgi:predicted enzyme related to lactoylglutathione lyase
VSLQSTRDVILRTHSLAAAKAYYHDVLGLPLVADSERLVGFDTGAITLYFELGDDNGQVFDFLTDDMAAAKAKLLAAGCVVVEDNPSIPRCYLRDPFGLTFNLDLV